MEPPRRAAIYTRISRDSTGEGAGVARQQDDCRGLATKLGFEVVEVFSDNDASAYSAKPRPGYLALIRAIKTARVDAVLVWHTDRLYRRMPDLETYITACQDRDVPTFAVQAGHLDLATPAGRMTARTLGAVAHYESEQKGVRQQRANLQRAREGRNFATKRCFGFEPSNIVLRPDEAEAIRNAYLALLDGATVASIARQWNAAGHRTPQKGNMWDGTNVSQLLRGRRNAGMRVYKGAVVTGDDGLPIAVEWPTIIDQDTWHAAQAILRDPRRSYPNGPQLMLSGVALCGVCGSKMLSGGTRNGRQRIRCGQGAGHSFREAEPIDDLVVRVILGYLSRPDIRTELLIDPENERAEHAVVRQQLADVQQRSDLLVTSFADGDITHLQLRDGQRNLAIKREVLEDRLPAARQATVRRMAQSADPKVVWDALDVDERRRVIDELVVIRVFPTGTKEAAYLDWRKRILNPATVRIEWRHEAAGA